MFFSYDAAEIPVPKELFQGARAWRFIEWDMDLPWLWVTAVTYEDEMDGAHSFMAYLPLDIVDYIERRAESLKSIDVQVVMPPWLSQTETWVMKPLSEIVSGILPSTGREVLFLKCADGVSYIDGDLYDKETVLEKQKTLYSAEAH